MSFTGQEIGSGPRSGDRSWPARTRWRRWPRRVSGFLGHRLRHVVVRRPATASAADFCHGLWLEGELGAIGGKDGAHTPGVRTDPAEAVDQDLIQVRAAVPVPLVLHGASGVPDDELRAAISHGLVKINIGTLNLAYTSAVRIALHTDTTLVDHRRYLDTARAAVSDTTAETLRVLHEIRVRA